MALLKLNSYSPPQEGKLQTRALIGGMRIAGEVVAVGALVYEKKDGRHYWLHFELRDKA